MFKKYLGVLKCSVCSSDYIPLKKFDPELIFLSLKSVKKKKFRVKISDGDPDPDPPDPWPFLWIRDPGK